jgi:hypothetical protein
MVIEIDDAGWGDLIGGVVIVMRRVGTNQRYSLEVPLSDFQGEAFGAKKYLGGVMIAITSGLEALKVKKEEELHICTGFILKQVREALRNEGWNVVPSKIVGETQRYAEEEFINHLSRIGVGPSDVAKSIRGFSKSLDWVLRNLNQRERFVKTGWKSWPRLRQGEL